VVAAQRFVNEAIERQSWVRPGLLGANIADNTSSLLQNSVVELPRNQPKMDLNRSDVSAILIE